MAKPECFNYKTTIDCLQQFICSHKIPDGKHLYIIMDNTPWHKKCKRLVNEDEQYTDIRKAATLISLSSYLPVLNPIE